MENKLTKIYKKGDTIRYRTIEKRLERTSYSDVTEKESVNEKTGVVEEAFTTVNGIPCYWVEGEKYLILQTMLVE